jgi:Extensin-like protein C-terminus
LRSAPGSRILARMVRRPLLLFGAALATLTLDAAAVATPAGEAPYRLDSLSRQLAPGTPFGCPDLELVDYKGGAIRVRPHARVIPEFKERLEKLEGVVAAVATEVYGRPPVALVDLGTFACRRMEGHPRWLSEHGLGNAIDVAGFDFGPLPRGATLPAGLDRTFKNGFEVRVQTHWKSKTGHAAVHARFLKLLARRLIARSDIFRVLLGPGYPGHGNHFHFDMAPSRMVQIFEDGQVLKPDPPPSSP